MAVYQGRRTRRQIIDQALKKAGNTKIVAAARVKLARMLEDLYVQHEWPFLYVELPIQLVQQTVLPADFLKVESPDTGLRITSIDGIEQDHPVFIVTPTEWRRRAIPRDDTADRPDIARIDYSGSFLYPWPVPASVCMALLVYKKVVADIDPTAAGFDADVPLFPYHGYLEEAMELWALQYEKDGRAVNKKMEVDEMLAKLLPTATPRDSNMGSMVELDPVIFQRTPRVNEE